METIEVRLRNITWDIEHVISRLKEQGPSKDCMNEKLTDVQLKIIQAREIFEKLPEEDREL